ncbi:DENN domain-containing protein 1B isoform X2 [Protopterus annectens]|uniref:DENN domain-containing protein 1B isoform X2 n=1 Tax=Protopterus annectens TaxID=7888 RepID=UPI001CFB4758|nr:DENN domain-containing protein 1B isoform X2 [Protopterus annectens]
MDSRLKEKPERTVDLALKVERPNTKNEDPVVLWKFPEDFRDQEVLQTVPKFCFPFDIERVSQNQVGQHFTFVLTDLDGKQRFGFCRLTSGGRICLCILSYLPWFEVYYRLLNTLSDYLAKGLENELNDLLQHLYDHPLPKPNTPLSLSVHSYFIAPDLTKLPTVPENRNLTEYFVAVHVNNMIQLYAAMLHERRIIITATKLSTLTACIHGSAAMLYPMYWQHIYIPVLPPHLLDYCCAPMPYLIGVHMSLMEKLKSHAVEDAIILNVDTNTFETPYDDINNLPSEVVWALKSKLKKQSTAMGNGVARAFLRAQAALFGSYRDALRYKPGEPITFCEESFVKHRSSTMKQFLETAVNLQLFKQFIEGRLQKLNAGRGFTDVFEDEITRGGFCGGNSKSYHQWMQTMKKGSALINTAVTKATPAMKNVYKFAKSHAKQGIKEMKSKLKQKDSDEDNGTCIVGSFPVAQPLTAHAGRRSNSEKRRLAQTRLHRPVTAVGNLDQSFDDDEVDNTSKLSSEDGDEASGYTYDSEESDDMGLSSNSGGEMDLLGEILDSLSIHSSDQTRLSGAKSLDFFKSMDDIDYKSTNKYNAPSVSNLDRFGENDGDQREWHRGQDDSAVNGKHLPPTLRKRMSSSDSGDSVPVADIEKKLSSSCSIISFPTITVNSQSPAGSTTYLDFMEYSNELGNKEGQIVTYEQTLTNTIQEHNPSMRPLSTFVPWRKDNRGRNTELLKNTSLHGQILTLCQDSSAFHHSFNTEEAVTTTKSSAKKTQDDI